MLTMMGGAGGLLSSTNLSSSSGIPHMTHTPDRHRHTPARSASHNRRHAHRDADGDRRGLGGPGCCGSEAAEEAEAGDPVPP